jgi:putative ABC transport system permease protein
VSIGGLDFEVIGTMRNKIQDSMYMGPDNENGFIPFGLMRDLKNLRDPDEIIFQPTSAELNKKALAAVREVVARRHHFDPKDDKATPEWDTIEDRAMINGFSLGLQAVLGLIGAVTLAVGGIGVMNIMLVSVTERTREIGVRKAIGAKRSSILMQFLIEAVTLSALGGIIGVILGAGLTLLLKFAVHMPAELSVFWVVTALVLCAMIGIGFGIYPAWKAARLDPVEALRYE